MEDVLGDVLRLIRIKSCIYFVNDFHDPWAMRIDGGGGAAMAQFHVVARGQCVLESAGETRELGTGDVVLLPRGGGHVLADRPGRAPVPGVEVMRSLSGDSSMFSRGGAPTRLICGHFDYRDDLRHPLIAQLPALIQVRAFETVAPCAIETILPMLAREMTDARPGASVVVERLAEILLVQVLRAHLLQAGHARGFLAALADGRLSRAIALIHAESHRRLKLGDLARAAGMSRSAFALRFKAVLDLSPIAYLITLRMFRACDLLRGSELSLAEVADRIGYDSDVAFGRAFKRVLGVSPAEYRRAAD